MREFWDSLGQFWLAVAGAIAAQWLLTEETMTKKQTAAAVVCGVLCAWFGTWPLVERYALSAANVPLVAGLLALTGRQIMAVVLKRAPETINAAIGWCIAWVMSKFKMVSEAEKIVERERARQSNEDRNNDAQ